MKYKGIESSIISQHVLKFVIILDMNIYSDVYAVA